MQINHHLVVALWDKAVATPDYEKKQWFDLSNQVLEANRLLKNLETYQSETSRRTPDTCRFFEKK
jgi:hypothetical protein